MCVFVHIFILYDETPVCAIFQRVSCTDAPSNNSNRETLFETIFFFIVAQCCCGGGGSDGRRGRDASTLLSLASLVSTLQELYSHWLHFVFKHFKYLEWKYEFMKSASVWRCWDRTQKSFRFILKHKNRNNNNFQCLALQGILWRMSECVCVCIEFSCFSATFLKRKENVWKTHSQRQKPRKKTPKSGSRSKGGR